LFLEFYIYASTITIYYNPGAARLSLNTTYFFVTDFLVYDILLDDFETKPRR